MRRGRAILGTLALALLGLAAACQTAPPVAVRPERVVMISYDGAGADLAWSWIADGVAADPDGLAAMASEGLTARRLRPVNPTLTAPNHASLATGALPEVTGIVSNRFHLPGTPITSTVSGFNTSPDVDTLWVAARRRGLRVGTLSWPGADGGAPARLADFGVLWPERSLAEGAVVELDPATAQRAPELPSADGLPTLAWQVPVALQSAVPDEVTLSVAVLDGDPDGRPRYDTVAARLAGGGDWKLLGKREWFDVAFDARASSDVRPRRYLVWSKPLYLEPLRGGLRLYRGPANRLIAYPDGFEDRLTAAVGPWPGAPDGRLLGEWWLDVTKGIDLDTFSEQVERLDRYLDDVLAWVSANERFDLVLAYHPGVDEYEHSSLIEDPDQWAYSPGAALAAREGLKRMGRSADLSVGNAWRALDPDHDALVVVSDHGQLPIHDLVDVRRLLTDAGLIERGPRGGVAETSPMTVVASGGCAHVYLNLIGREPTGVVEPARAPELERRAARALADLSVDGRPVVERIVIRAEAAAIGLDSPSSGDLIAFLEPGYAFGRSTTEDVISPSRYYGQHGYLASHDALCGMFFARGGGIRPRRVEEMQGIQVAPLIESWLGVEPPTRSGR